MYGIARFKFKHGKLILTRIIFPKHTEYTFMLKKLLLISIGATLYGCGGGGDSSPTTTETTTPVVDTQTPAVIGGNDTGSVVDNSSLIATGELTIQDDQAGEDAFQAQTDSAVDYGLFSISEQGAWNFTLSQNDSSVSALANNEQATSEITVTSVDGTSHVITITVNGINDSATFSLAEIDNINADNDSPIEGTAVVSDIDNGEGAVVAQTEVSTEYGFFSIDTSGDWGYTLDVNNQDVSGLAENSTLEDSIIISSDDGTTTSIDITIVGVVQETESNFISQSTVTLDSDGTNTGLSAYTLIENAFADGSIEAPDFYSTNHTDVEHIVEDEDATVGPHFVFLAHRDLDHDKGNDPSDRQRNEIKTYDNSDENLKGYLNDTFQYSWKFKVTSDMELSSRFSHFFQIKAKNYSEDNTNGNDNQPIFTLSGAEKSSSGNELQVRYNSGYDINGDSTSDVYLYTGDWSLITDEWLEVFVQITYAEEGKFKLTLTRMSDNSTIIDLDEQNIDTWRGFEAADFVRPKWGIYRSILETESLREDEEQVRFANFVVSKGTLAE